MVPPLGELFSDIRHVEVIRTKQEKREHYTTVIPKARQ